MFQLSGKPKALKWKGHDGRPSCLALRRRRFPNGIEAIIFTVRRPHKVGLNPVWIDEKLIGALEVTVGVKNNPHKIIIKDFIPFGDMCPNSLGLCIGAVEAEIHVIRIVQYPYTGDLWCRCVFAGVDIENHCHRCGRLPSWIVELSGQRNIPLNAFRSNYRFGGVGRLRSNGLRHRKEGRREEDS